MGLKFEYTNALTERVEQISFSQSFAGYGATVIMDSTNSKRNQKIDKFLCTAPGSCQDTSVKLFGGAGINDVQCALPNYCNNCNIYVCQWGPVGEELCGTGKPCFRF